MPSTTVEEIDSFQLTEEQQREVILRCTGLIDFLSETAVNIIVDFVKEPPCPTAREILLNKPQVMVARALEQAWKNWVQANHRPPGTSLH
jgi:hypothetical protein